MDKIAKAVGNYLATRTEPAPIENEIDCRLLDIESWDFSPENHIGHYNMNTNSFDLSFVQDNLLDGISAIKRANQKSLPVSECATFLLIDFFESIGKGKSGRGKTLPPGDFPLVSTSEYNNGISEFVDKARVEIVYTPGTITISSNGGSCCAFYHDYDFAANPDVFVLKLKSEFNSESFGLFLCAAVNNEKWRYNYYRKFGRDRLNRLQVKIPVKADGQVDFNRITRIVTDGYQN